MGAQPEAEKLYPIHASNIHEQRTAAFVVRGLPLTLLVLPFVLCLVGLIWCKMMFLVVVAFLNVAIWIFIVSSAGYAIMGMSTCRDLIAHYSDIEEAKLKAPSGTWSSDSIDQQEGQDAAIHVVIFANYKEDEAMLAETLQSLSEAKGATKFWAVLAMETREDGAQEKAARLQSQFQGSFAKVMATFHPATLKSVHLDGSVDDEVPGKASNVKWAAEQIYDMMSQAADICLDNVVVTISDSDCLFHPYYFDSISREFSQMRISPGDQHKWTMWQAPQLPYRNYYISPIPSRAWGYISSMFEAGGVSSLSSGGHHMVFSSYSLSLQLGIDAEIWDGDIIAEDHHAYLKCFFYSVKRSTEEAFRAEAANKSHGGCQPRLRVRSVMLPVKSTSVVGESYWQTYLDRWNQAVRHTQGAAEMSYCFLCTWDLFCSMPARMYNFGLLIKLWQVNCKMLCMHTLPNVQVLCLAVMTLYWFLMGRRVDFCPSRISFDAPDNRTLVCGLAGAWVLTWPVVIPLSMIIVANHRFISEAFLKPARFKGQALASVWHSCDGGVPPTWGSTSLTVFYTIVTDCILLPVMMAVYGLTAEFIGCWNVMLRGNRFKYITAAKLLTESPTSYGTLNN